MTTGPGYTATRPQARRRDAGYKSPRPHVPRPGATLGPYTIRADLGHGGMGVVYTAHDPRLKRQVAIKLLTADLTRDETAKQRFLQEAQAASALDHPNICTSTRSTRPSTASCTS